MKTTLITLAMALATFATTAVAADPVLSPKARELRGNAPLRGGTEVRLALDFARGKAANAPNVVVAGAAKDRDLVREERAVVYTGKNALRDTRGFEIAPVK